MVPGSEQRDYRPAGKSAQDLEEHPSQQPGSTTLSAQLCDPRAPQF
jgi:hypothetical protein